MGKGGFRFARATGTVMLALAVRNTKKLVREKVREDNVRLGRLFTKKGTAALMASFFSCGTDTLHSGKVSVLDPGAGTGILSAALTEALCIAGATEEISLTCYENNAAFLPMLQKNLAAIRRKCRREYGVKFTYIIKEENFILSARDLYRPSLFCAEAPPLYDMVIMTPPSLLLRKDAPEALALPELSGADNDLAFCFAAFGMLALRDGGQMVAALPVSFAANVYRADIRDFLAKAGTLSRIHTFFRRSGSEYHPDTAKREAIFCFTKSPLPKDATVLVSSSLDEGKEITLLPPLPYAEVVRPTGEILLLQSEDDEKILSFVRAFPETMTSLGLRMRTGLFLESRYPDAVYDTPQEDAVPLIHPENIDNGTVRLPVKRYIVPKLPSLAQPNKNLLFCKRVPAKRDRRHLLCAAYLASQFPHYRLICTHNKLNFIDFADQREMDAPFLYGLYAVLSSDLYERYCTLLSKAPQINAADYRDLPLPSAATLREIGNRLLISRIFTPRSCNAALSSVLRKGAEAKEKS